MLILLNWTNKFIDLYNVVVSPQKRNTVVPFLTIVSNTARYSLRNNGFGQHVLNDEYYFQNFYEQNLYREAIDNGRFPIYRGLKMKQDDVIRREVIRHVRTFFNIEFSFFEKKYELSFKEYFKKELKNLISFEKDQLIQINDNNVVLSPLGEHFSPQVANVFDVYNDQEFYKRDF